MFMNCDRCWNESAKSVCTREEAGGTTGTPSIQPGNDKDWTLQQMATNWCMPIWRPLSICPWHRRAPPSFTPPTLQNRSLPDGPRRRSLPIWPPLSLPPCSHPGREAHEPPPRQQLTVRYLSPGVFIHFLNSKIQFRDVYIFLINHFLVTEMIE